MTTQESQLTPAQVRARIRAGEVTGQTSALCPGYTQANLAILPRDWAFDFLLFAMRNPKPCPILEVLDPGDPYTKDIADHADVRKDLPRYRIYKKGVLVDEPTDITDAWQDDLVSFFIGCSFTFDHALVAAGLPVRHLEEGSNVPMYRTTRPNAKAGRLGGPLVVSMRPMPVELVDQAVEVSDRFGGAHGGPVHVGDPEAIGIADIGKPDFGDAVPIKEGEVPVFWACGVTPQAVVMEAAPPLAITHAPGHMFISDIKSEMVNQAAACKA